MSPYTTTNLPRFRQLVTQSLTQAGVPPAEIAAIVAKLGAPTRFCDGNCRRHFHAAADLDEQNLTPRPGHCWFCGCTLPAAAPDERYFLAKDSASPNYHYGTSYTVIQMGTLQLVAVEADDLDEAMERFFAGLHLAVRETFPDAAAAYVAARAELDRRTAMRQTLGQPPARRPPPPRHIDRALTGGVSLRASAIDRDGLPAMEVLIQTAHHPVPSWVLRTGVQNVREVDRALRQLGVRFATLVGAQLWVDLGLPVPTAPAFRK